MNIRCEKQNWNQTLHSNYPTMFNELSAEYRDVFVSIQHVKGPASHGKE